MGSGMSVPLTWIPYFFRVARSFFESIPLCFFFCVTFRSVVCFVAVDRLEEEVGDEEEEEVEVEED